MGEISSNAQGNGIGAEFVNGRDRAIALYHTECRRSVCNNDIDVPPLQLLNERGNLFQKVICEKRIALKLDPLFADNLLEQVPALVEELERRHVNVIVTHAAATFSVVKGNRTIPAIYEFSADPVALGIAADLAHPLFNATGITLMMAELNSKRLEALREIEPNIRRIAIVANPLHPGSEFERKDSETKARQLGMEISFFPTPNREELDRALGAIEASPLQAMLLFSDAFVVEHRKQIIDFAMRRGIPIISGWAIIADSG